MVKLYGLERGVYEDYISGTKRGKNCNEFIVRLKLSAMIYATNIVTKWKDLKIYRIGTFSIVVKNGSPNVISLAYWGDYSYKINKDSKEKLKYAYTELGLSDDGQSYAKELPPIE